MQVDESEFCNRLLDYQNVLILCHRNADPDALGSAFALSEVIGGTIGLSDGCNRIASFLIDKLQIKVIDIPDPSEYDFVIVVDTSAKSQLNDIELTDYCVIDHHTTAATSLNENALFYLHRNLTSTAEIVFEIMKQIGAPLTRRVALALMTGIITDTGHFKHATPHTFRVVANMIELSGVNYYEVLDLLSATPQDISIRIAMLKSIAQAEIERIHDWLVVTSQVSSFGGLTSSMLLNIGADVALIGTTQDGVAKINGRVKRDAIKAGINLGKILEEISENYEGTGGGHTGAAGIDVVADLDEVLDECKNRVRRILIDVQNPIYSTSK